MAKITITIEDNLDKRGRVIVRVDGNYSDNMDVLKANELTPAQMVSIVAVDVMNELQEAANASGGTLQQYLVNDLYKHLFQNKAVRNERLN